MKVKIKNGIPVGFIGFTDSEISHRYPDYHDGWETKVNGVTSAEWLPGAMSTANAVADSPY
jgi:hypothetical protein